jgi:Polysaccharide biosynthesis C-terminal domain
LLEGTINLLLSVFLARRMGIVGVAWGTAIPLACTSLFFLPQHLCRVLGVPLGTFLRRAYRLPLALGAAQAAVLWLVSRQFPAHGYFGVALQIASSGIVYWVGFAWAFFNAGLTHPRSWHALTQLLEPK